jgi:hypothetical protein
MILEHYPFQEMGEKDAHQQRIPKTFRPDYDFDSVKKTIMSKK